MNATQLSEKAKERYRRYKAIIEDEANLTSEKVTEAEEIQKELKGIREQIEGIQAQEKRVGDLKSAGGEFEEWMNAPVTPVPFGGPEPDAKLLSTRRDGQAEVEKRSEGGTAKWWVNDEGDSLVSDKIIQTINGRDYKDAFRTYLRKGTRGLSSPQIKVIQEGEDEGGGYLVPGDVLARLLDHKPTPTRVLARTTQITTGRDRVSVPRVNYDSDEIYTTGVRVTSTGEIPASSTVHRVTEPLFGRVTIPVHTYMMSLPITNDMLEDTDFPLISWVSGKFRETIDLTREDKVINGDGINHPLGLLAAPGTDGHPKWIGSGSATDLTEQGLIDIGFSIPEQYDENAVFVFNKRSAGKQIGSMRDGENRLVWNTGALDNGLSNATTKAHRLLNYDQIYSAFMPDVAANAYPLILGDLSGYITVNRIGFSIQVLNEVEAQMNQKVILGRMRFGGGIAEPWKIKIQKVTTVASS